MTNANQKKYVKAKRQSNRINWNGKNSFSPFMSVTFGILLFLELYYERSGSHDLSSISDWASVYFLYVWAKGCYRFILGFLFFILNRLFRPENLIQVWTKLRFHCIEGDCTMWNIHAGALSTWLSDPSFTHFMCSWKLIVHNWTYSHRLVSKS